MPSDDMTEIYLEDDQRYFSSDEDYYAGIGKLVAYGLVDERRQSDWAVDNVGTTLYEPTSAEQWAHRWDYILVHCSPDFLSIYLDYPADRPTSIRVQEKIRALIMSAIEEWKQQQ